MFRRDLFEKTGVSPVGMLGPVACEAHHRIKDAGYRRKQEGVQFRPEEAHQPIDIPQKYAPRQLGPKHGSKPFIY
jgi:hypothetical protein